MSVCKSFYNAVSEIQKDEEYIIRNEYEKFIIIRKHDKQYNDKDT